MSTGLGLTLPLKSLVQSKFDLAKQFGALVFSSTELTILHTSKGVPFQLRYCPALAKKPKDNGPSDKSKKKIDPFENPPEELFIANIPSQSPTHILVLNKYPVISNHFIIATKANKQQTHLLEENDLAMTLACLQTWEAESQERLFAFFNSGANSGASQPHRHVQFLPFHDVAADCPSSWSLLVDSLTQSMSGVLPFSQNISLPFVHYAVNIDEKESSATLYEKYVSLMKAATQTATKKQGPISVLEEGITIEDQGEAIISYNLAMTCNRLVIFPRKAETAKVPGAGNDSDVAINGTILGGTLMVKHEDEWNTLRQDSTLLDGMLREIGFVVASKDEVANEQAATATKL